MAGEVKYLLSCSPCRPQVVLILRFENLDYVRGECLVPSLLYVNAALQEHCDEAYSSHSGVPQRTRTTVFSFVMEK